MSKVYLVGGGPGDPGLITVKGRQALAVADCVLYDNLAPNALLAFAPPGAERIYVGKKKGDHAFSQEEITRLLIGKARGGQDRGAAEGRRSVPVRARRAKRLKRLSKRAFPSR